MDVELPEGCNIINSSSSFYNYTNNNRTRALYYIYEGKALKANESFNQYGYDYSGTCLVTGDLVYQPDQKEVWFPIVSIIVSLILFYGAYKLILSHWWRYK